MLSKVVLALVVPVHISYNMNSNNIIEFPKITFYVVSQYIHRRALICTIIGYIIRILSAPKIPVPQKFLLQTT